MEEEREIGEREREREKSKEENSNEITDHSSPLPLFSRLRRNQCVTATTDHNDAIGRRSEPYYPPDGGLREFYCERTSLQH